MTNYFEGDDALLDQISKLMSHKVLETNYSEILDASMLAAKEEHLRHGTTKEIKDAAVKKLNELIDEQNSIALTKNIMNADSDEKLVRKNVMNTENETLDPTFWKKLSRRMRHSYCHLPFIKDTEHCKYGKHMYENGKQAWHGHTKNAHNKLRYIYEIKKANMWDLAIKVKLNPNTIEDIKKIRGPDVHERLLGIINDQTSNVSSMKVMSSVITRPN